MKSSTIQSHRNILAYYNNNILTLHDTKYDTTLASLSIDNLNYFHFSHGMLFVVFENTRLVTYDLNNKKYYNIKNNQSDITTMHTIYNTDIIDVEYKNNIIHLLFSDNILRYSYSSESLNTTFKLIDKISTNNYFTSMCVTNKGGIVVSNRTNLRIITNNVSNYLTYKNDSDIASYDVIDAKIFYNSCNIFITENKKVFLLKNNALLFIYEHNSYISNISSSRKGGLILINNSELVDINSKKTLINYTTIKSNSVIVRDKIFHISDNTLMSNSIEYQDREITVEDYNNNINHSIVKVKKEENKKVEKFYNKLKTQRKQKVIDRELNSSSTVMIHRRIKIKEEISVNSDNFVEDEHDVVKYRKYEEGEGYGNNYNNGENFSNNLSKRRKHSHVREEDNTENILTGAQLRDSSKNSMNTMNNINNYMSNYTPIVTDCLKLNNNSLLVLYNKYSHMYTTTHEYGTTVFIEYHTNSVELNSDIGFIVGDTVNSKIDEYNTFSIQYVMCSSNTIRTNLYTLIVEFNIKCVRCSTSHIFCCSSDIMYIYDINSKLVREVYIGSYYYISNILIFNNNCVFYVFYNNNTVCEITLDCYNLSVINCTTINLSNKVTYAYVDTDNILYVHIDKYLLRLTNNLFVKVLDTESKRIVAVNDGYAIALKSMAVPMEVEFIPIDSFNSSNFNSNSYNNYSNFNSNYNNLNTNKEEHENIMNKYKEEEITKEEKKEEVNTEKEEAQEINPLDYF